MKTQDTNTATAENVIDATKALKAKRARESGTRGASSLTGLKLLKGPALGKEESKIIDLYIAARRREQAAAVAAEDLKPQVLRIVREHQQVARRGAVVSLDHSYRWHYSGTVTVLAKTLSEERERERENGTAKATVSATVAFEDIRRKDRERRVAMEKSA
jgi:hypothetical protein